MKTVCQLATQPDTPPNQTLVQMVKIYVDKGRMVAASRSKQLAETTL